MTQCNTDVIEVGQPMMDRWMLELTDAERARHAVYLLVGSLSQPQPPALAPAAHSVL